MRSILGTGQRRAAVNLQAWSPLARCEIFENPSDSIITVHCNISYLGLFARCIAAKAQQATKMIVIGAVTTQKTQKSADTIFSPGLGWKLKKDVLNTACDYFSTEDSNSLENLLQQRL